MCMKDAKQTVILLSVSVPIHSKAIKVEGMTYRRRADMHD